MASIAAGSMPVTPSVSKAPHIKQMDTIRTKR